MPSVDLSRYAERWYEVARLPNKYQERVPVIKLLERAGLNSQIHKLPDTMSGGQQRGRYRPRAHEQPTHRARG
ncbi:MAG: lipocalin family protein [Pyrinomonadaceae bacterium]|nr:lipocalin family protein [Pyrinomonadaceae bacterium]